jgi:hypothetical protein
MCIDTIKSVQQLPEIRVGYVKVQRKFRLHWNEREYLRVLLRLNYKRLQMYACVFLRNKKLMGHAESAFKYKAVRAAFCGAKTLAPTGRGMCQWPGVR